MAKLYFYYSAMNAGKSTMLLQSAHNYTERGMTTILFTPAWDTRYQQGKITSRIGLSARAEAYHPDTDFEKTLQHFDNSDIDCIFVDEAQFLSRDQVSQLGNIVDDANIPVLTYGLRNDFRSEPFEGSMYLLAWADELVEIKTVCHCGRKATHVYRLNNGQVVTSGKQIVLGGNEQYVSVCRSHYKSAVKNKTGTTTSDDTGPDDKQ